MRTLLVIVIVLIVAAIGVGISRRRQPAPPPSTAPALSAPSGTTTPSKTTRPPRSSNDTAPEPVALPPIEEPTTAPTSTSPSSPPAAPAFAAFTIEADDAGFYPATITVSRDIVISITFKVRADGVHDGGLDIQSPYFSTGSISAGGVKTITFRSPPRPETISFFSSAQGTGYRKAEGTIVVE